MQHRLAVEVYGWVHHIPEQAAHDLERDAFLESQGIRVLRFTNEEIENQLEGVLQKILETVGK